MTMSAQGATQARDDTTRRRPIRVTTRRNTWLNAAPATASIPNTALELAVGAPPEAGAPAASTTRPLSPKVLRRRQVVADVAAVAAGVLIALTITEAASNEAHLEHPWVVGVITALAWMMCLGMNRLYMARAVARLGEELQRIAVAGLAATGLSLIVTGLAGIDTPDAWIATSFACVATALVAERLVARRAFNKMRAAGRLRRRVAIIGTDRHAQELYRSLNADPELGYEVVGMIGVGERRLHATKGPVLGHLTDTETILDSTDCGGVMVSLNSIDPAEVNRLSRQLTDAGYHVALSTSLCDIDIGRLRPQAVGAQTLVYLEPTIRSGWRMYAKRVFDITLATIGLIVSAPIVAIAAIAIRLDSKGPTFFRQVRVGRDGREFEMIKLRTMTADAEQRLAELADYNEADGPLFKMANDPRITRVGRFLRRASIDELPQFWNVLRGEMSMVGPRPALPSEVAEWDDELRERLRVLPGVTGFWQVSGRSSTTFAEYKRLDLYYVDNWSLPHDLRIVLKTFAVVLTQRGAS